MKFIMIIISGLLLFSSCMDAVTGSGNIVTEKRKVERFTGIESQGSISIEVFNGPEYSVEVEADDNVLEHVITKVNDGKLEVHYRHNMSFTNVHAKVIVTGPSFDRLSAKGSGNITAKNPVNHEKKIEIILRGSGNITAEVNAPEVVVESRGSGDVILSGRTRTLDANAKGSGSLQCSRLLSETTTIDLAGSGGATVFASVALKGSIKGSGSLVYSGNPSTKQVNDGGSGSVRAN